MKKCNATKDKIKLQDTFTLNDGQVGSYKRNPDDPNEIEIVIFEGEKKYEVNGLIFNDEVTVEIGSRIVTIGFI